VGIREGPEALSARRSTVESEMIAEVVVYYFSNQFKAVRVGRGSPRYSYNFIQ
jgi:hypothetical protein